MSSWLSADYESGFYLGLYPAATAPADSDENPGPVANMRLVRLKSFTGVEYNCALAEVVTAEKWAQLLVRHRRNQDEQAFDAPLLSQAKLIVAAAAGVLTELAASGPVTDHAQRHLAKLQKLGYGFDAAPATLTQLLDTSGGLNKATQLVVVTALALGQQPSAVFRQAEERVALFLA